MAEKPYITQMSMDEQTVAVSKDLFDYVLLVAWDSVLKDYWQEEAVDWLGWS